MVRKKGKISGQIAVLRLRMDALHRDYEFSARVSHDPIAFPRSYSSAADMEVAGFIASSLAYGRITLFMPVLKSIFKVMGKHPARFARGFHINDASALDGIAYRFQKPSDIAALVYIIGETLRSHGSLESAFMAHYSPEHEDIGPALGGFINELRSVNVSALYKSKQPMAAAQDGLMQLLPSPESGSACKRLCLYLRWMVRDRDIDLGVWKGVRKNQLIVPLDTHIMKVSQRLKFTSRKSATWLAATEITRALRELDPKDPLKYDFVLCHMGVTGEGNLLM